METSESEEPEKKRPHLNPSLSPTMARNSSTSPPDSKWLQILAADCLSELEDARDENQTLSKELENLENELKDDKHIHSSRLFSLVNDQLQHWDDERERYKTLTDPSEEEVKAKVESAVPARNIMDTAEPGIEDLKLHKCIIEKNDLAIKMEEAVQDSGRKDIKEEFRVMASALSKEMGMMEAHLTRWKQTAYEAVSLCEESKSLKALLNEKVEQLQSEKQELQIILDVYGQEGYDNRNVLEIKESEHRAHSRLEVLKNVLDEHHLDLRVKAVNEAEAACQQRISANEAEIAELRAKLDASERGVFELKEAIKSKDKEAEAYISEIENIGQAYEDMQTQNQHLLQQVSGRDDYNIKLVSECAKTKQAQSFLLSDKQALAKHLQQLNASVESLKSRIAHGVEQMKHCLIEAFRSTEEESCLAINIEIAQWELMYVEEELKWFKSAVASFEKEYEQIPKKIDEIQTEPDIEREKSDSITGRGKIAELDDVDAGIDVEDRLDVKHEEVKKYNDYLESDTESDMSEEDSKEYWRQVTESDGFDVDDHFSKYRLCGVIIPQPRDEILFDQYTPFAEIAILQYNKDNNANFKIVRLEQVNLQSLPWHFIYYITFQATDEDTADAPTTTFQAKLIDDCTGYLSGSGKPEIIIELCRLKRYC